jgi:predicted DNA-binding transcriptional regulator AlpA
MESGKTTSPGDRLINRRELRQRIPVSDMSVWRWIRAGIFPAPLKINNRNYWRLNEVLAFIHGTSPKPEESGP